MFPARNQKGQAVVLFLGIIDILQNYRLFKKFEHAWKSLLYEAVSDFYSFRFPEAIFKYNMKGSLLKSRWLYLGNDYASLF